MATITFRVNLTPAVGHLSPTSKSGHTDAAIASRGSWFPNDILNNRGLSHGDEFTVSGVEAYYLRENFTSGEFKFLDVV